jgi:hypothetical protein
MSSTTPLRPAKIEVRTKVSESLYRWMQEEADRLGLNVAAVVRMALTAKFSKPKQAAGKQP